MALIAPLTNNQSGANVRAALNEVIDQVNLWSSQNAPPGSVAGPAGPPGADGPPGPPGAPGLRGAQGIQGIQGVAGAPGATGARGLTGANGTNGTNGTNGAAGPTGPAGPTFAGGTLGLQTNFGPTATLTDAATIAWNLAAAQVAKVTLAGNRTLGAPTNMVDGGTYILRVAQDATGGRTLTFNAVYRFPGRVDPTLSTAPGAIDYLTFLSDGVHMDGVWQGDFG